MKKIVIVIALIFSTLLTNISVSANAQTYSDVPTTHPFYKEISFLVSEGVLTPSAKLGINSEVTRKEVAVLVSKALKLNGTPTKTKFKDISASDSASGYINSAVNAGVINGYTDGTFRPNLIVTRGQMAIFLSNAFKLQEMALVEFKDVPKSSAAYEAIKKITNERITTGFAGNIFKPNETLTRGQIAAFLARAMKFESKAPVDLSKGTGTVKGTITWQYNAFIGTKPDVGAKVFLIPEDFKHKFYTQSEMELYSMMGFIPTNANLHFTKVNGYGLYELNNVPVGKYVIVISSANTTRDPDLETNLALYIEHLLGKPAYEKFQLFNEGYKNFGHRYIEVKKDQIIDVSKDWGYTYF